MPVHDTGRNFSLSVHLFFAVVFFGVGCWIGRHGTQELDRWQRCLSDRRTPAGDGWEQLTRLDGIVELGHANGAAYGTTTATARNTAHSTTDATADDTTMGAASGTAAGTLDGTADATAVGNTDITARGAASELH